MHLNAITKHQLSGPWLRT